MLRMGIDDECRSTRDARAESGRVVTQDDHGFIANRKTSIRVSVKVLALDRTAAPWATPFAGMRRQRGL